MRNALMDAPWLCAVAQVFTAADVPLYIVGGAVRNPLLDLPISDVDVCGPALPDTVCRLCEGTPVHAHLRAAHFGTVELHYADEQGNHMAEYTTWREDSYRCGHRPEAVRFSDSVEVDACRRDFSVNALYRRVYPDGLGEIIDPTGGLSHLQNHILHTVTEDPDRVLRDDGLRILRAARFQAEMDLSPTSELRASLKKYAPILADIAPERLRDELQKTLLADLRYDTLPRRESGTWQGLETIARCGAWKMLFPGIPYSSAAAFAMGHAPTPDGIFAVSGNPLPARLGLLLRHADVSLVQKALNRMCFAQNDIQKVVLYLNVLHGLGNGLSLVEAARAGTEALLVCGAICEALGEENHRAQIADLLSALGGKPLSLKQLAVNGNEILCLLTERGLPAKHTGKLLDHLWQQAVEGKIPNEKKAILDAARTCLRSELPIE